MTGDRRFKLSEIVSVVDIILSKILEHEENWSLDRSRLTENNSFTKIFEAVSLEFKELSTSFRQSGQNMHSLPRA